MIHFLRNTLKIYRRNAGYTIINLVGLSIGLAAGILILLYIFNELSYDRFHRNGHDLYRVNMVFVNQDGVFPSYTIPAAVGPSLGENFSGIQSVTRLTQPNDAYFVYKSRLFEISDVCYADSGFFNDFSFRLILGNPLKVLREANQVVLTKSTAEAIFGEESPLGKVLAYNNAEQFVVTGIAADPPANSSIRFKALLSFTTLYQDKTLHLGWNGGNQYITYLRTIPGFDFRTIEPGLESFLEDKINREISGSGGKYNLRFEPMFDIYLHPYYDDGSGGSIGNIRIFSAIALLIIIIACFNFTSLSTARAIRRSRETGIRKVAGASRGRLIRQFLGEALVLSFISLLLALFIIELVQPWYNAVTGLSLSLYSSSNLWFAATIFLLMITTGILAGAYPAFYLASFNPVSVLKGGSGSVKVASLIPGIAVIIQFAISAGLINGLLVISAQLNYVRDYNPGFNSAEVLALNLPGGVVSRKHAFVGSELLRIPGIKSWAAVSEPPGTGVTSNGYFPEGYRDAVLINVIDTDSGFIETLGIKLLSGRNFKSGSAIDSQAFLVNETYARRFKIAANSNSYVSRDGKHPIIGVVSDFNFNSLHTPVEPLILTMQPWKTYDYLLLRIGKGRSADLLPVIEKQWHKMFPEEPFICTPLDLLIAGNYTKEKNFARLYSGFTMAALIVACLGLFGLSAIILQQRRRELGIRRILGASPWLLTLKVTAGFTKLVLFANLIAAVPVWFIMKDWLAGFSYPVNLSLLTFLYTAIVTLLLAWLTILWQSLRTARLNPVEVIKYE